MRRRILLLVVLGSLAVSLLGLPLGWTAPAPPLPPYDLTGGYRLQHEENIWRAPFSANGTRIATAAED